MEGRSRSGGSGDAAGRTDTDVGAEVLSAASGDCGREHQPSPPGIDPRARSALRFDDDTH
ncbi:hypothetical protein C1I64_17075 [Rathayibacter festucae DSM 15932]|uniref:Uncharacterized protein n=1 Tax=Rathayibacter festucae DSM 15932 TaxID=1328866 RepID=A0A3Q9V0K5_9MICO|nr:hypothetical protein C1I64_17075 [Rathayibacter festucae DSM 15932]